MQQSRNLLLFFLVATAILFLWIPFRQRFFPPPPSTNRQEEDPSKVKDVVRLPVQPPITSDRDVLQLGTSGEDSRFALSVVLDPLGAGVRSVTLNHFRAANEDGKPLEEPLVLVPASANLREPSHLLFHFDPRDGNADRPLDTLGRMRWKVLAPEGKAVVVDEVEGKARQQVSFQAEIEGVLLTKTYSLIEGEYHVGLEVRLERAPGQADTNPVNFRYQLTGAKGLPIEGKWYTATFRNAVIGVEDERGNLYRELMMQPQLTHKAGGDAIKRKQSNPEQGEQGQYLRYAGVAVQYFASVIAVDNEQSWRNFLQQARPTQETAVLRGRIKPGTLTLPDRLVLLREDGRTTTVVYLPEYLRPIRGQLRDNQSVAVVYRTLSYVPALREAPRLAEDVRVGLDADATHAPWEDDLTVRVNTEAVALKPGQEAVTHRYVLYNGPAKPSLLRHLHGENAVAPEVISRYVNDLHLNSIVDHQMNNWFGSFLKIIMWTDLVIACTNVMHWVLGHLIVIIPSYGLAILVLTILVRLIMFPLSRKQALMALKMQALAPELKQLRAKFTRPDGTVDQQGFAQEQMALFRKHKVNPFGSCWVILLQMPIMMGLYFALQESISFRLASFWPTWITNLAAPDMLLYWTRSIPLISRDADYGGMFYLGPYFNLLPIFAVALMVIQQQIMMPPAADKEQEMQQTTMKFMMILMGFFFYKIAAGLCIYIIVSTLWGFAERQFLPKMKNLIDQGAADKTTILARIDEAAVRSKVGVPLPELPEGRMTKGESGRKAKNRRKKAAQESKPEPPTRWQKLRDWWNDVLEQARKK